MTFAAIFQPIRGIDVIIRCAVQRFGRINNIFLWCLEGLHRLIGNNYQFSISGKARENMETVKRSSNNVIEFLQSEGYIRFRADSEASSKAIYEAYTRWCDDNAQKPMSANRVSSELAQNERLYNVEATNNVHVGGKRVRGFTDTMNVSTTAAMQIGA